jgi:hypothetical protein
MGRGKGRNENPQMQAALRGHFFCPFPPRHRRRGLFLLPEERKAAVRRRTSYFLILVVLAYEAYLLFHGLKLRIASTDNSGALQLPLKHIALSSIVMYAAGFSYANVMSNSFVASLWPPSRIHLLRFSANHSPIAHTPACVFDRELYITSY